MTYILMMLSVHVYRVLIKFKWKSKVKIGYASTETEYHFCMNIWTGWNNHLICYFTFALHADDHIFHIILDKANIYLIAANNIWEWVFYSIDIKTTMQWQHYWLIPIPYSMVKSYWNNVSIKCILFIIKIMFWNDLWHPHKSINVDVILTVFDKDRREVIMHCIDMEDVKKGISKDNKPLMYHPRSIDSPFWCLLKGCWVCKEMSISF